jgi:hypothetical protein
MNWRGLTIHPLSAIEGCIDQLMIRTLFGAGEDSHRDRNYLNCKLYLNAAAKVTLGRKRQLEKTAA